MLYSSINIIVSIRFMVQPHSGVIIGYFIYFLIPNWNQSELENQYEFLEIFMDTETSPNYNKPVQFMIIYPKTVEPNQKELACTYIGIRNYLELTVIVSYFD